MRGGRGSLRGFEKNDEAHECRADRATALTSAPAGFGVGGDVQIHHLVLKRVDGSELWQEDVAALGDAPRIGSMIELSLTGSVRVPARVTGVETLTVLTRGGGTSRPSELTVHAQEVMCAPVAANDP